MKRILALLLALLASLSLVSCASINLELGDVIDGVTQFIESEDNFKQEAPSSTGEIEREPEKEEQKDNIEENGRYMAKEEVALYVYTYNKLPSNFIKKRDATDLGWESSKGNLWDVTDKKSIGGDKFGNREKLLPIKDGRVYYEADINYDGKFRGAERIVYSNDGLVYYTGDHYGTFTLLYGDESL